MTGRRWRLHAIGVTLCAAAYGYGLFRLLGKVPLSEAAGDALSVPLWVMDRVVWPLTFGVGLTWAVALGAAALKRHPVGILAAYAIPAAYWWFVVWLSHGL